MKQIKPAFFIFSIFTILTGILYPFLITGIAQFFFPQQANGSLVFQDVKITGSKLIGQEFDDPKYFWGRPSATSSVPYSASESGGTNYSALNPGLQNEMKSRIASLRNADPENQQKIPVDLVTSSASGLDPDISVDAAYYQATRVAKARSLSIDQVNALIQQHTHNRILGIFGEETVNVLEINLALDKIK